MPLLSLRKTFLSLLALTLLLGQIPLPAQADSKFTEDFQTWQIGSIRGHITKRLMYYLDMQNNVVNLTDKRGNSRNNDTHEGQILVRPAIGLQLTKSLSFWQGYGWTPSYQPQFRNENQVWEQILYERRFKHVNVSNRSRLEMRYIADTSAASVRFRNQFRLAFPLGKTKWSLVAYDEPFFNLNTVQNGPRGGFNQNWAFIGVGRRLSKSVNLDIGYLNNYVRNFRPVADRINNVIFVSLNVNMPGTGFDLRKPNNNEPANKGTDPSLKSSDDSAPNTLAQAAGAQPGVASLLPVAQPNLEIEPLTSTDKTSDVPQEHAVANTATVEIPTATH